MLKDDAAVRTGAGNGPVLDRNRAVLDRQEPADEVEERTLAAAAGPQQRDELALGDRQRHIVERQHRAAARRPAIELRRVAAGIGRIAGDAKSLMFERSFRRPRHRGCGG